MILNLAIVDASMLLFFALEAVIESALWMYHMNHAFQTRLLNALSFSNYPTYSSPFFSSAVQSINTNEF